MNANNNQWFINKEFSGQYLEFYRDLGQQSMILRAPHLSGVQFQRNYWIYWGLRSLFHSWVMRGKRNQVWECLDGSLMVPSTLYLGQEGSILGGNVPQMSFSFSVMASQAQSPFINSSFSQIDSVKQKPIQTQARRDFMQNDLRGV